MISLRRYFILSALAAGAVIYHAFATRRQFFPATVALSTSKLAVATVGNLSFAMALCMYNLVIKVNDHTAHGDTAFWGRNHGS